MQEGSVLQRWFERMATIREAASRAFGGGPANAAGRRQKPHALRCVLLHNVGDEASPFTAGLNVTISRGRFVTLIDALARHYAFVDLDRALSPETLWGERPPLLVTFDDCYASLASDAAPICERLGIPAVFFLNARPLGNRVLMLDNVLAYVASTKGMGVIERVAGRRFTDLPAVLLSYLPLLRLEALERFADDLAEAANVDRTAAAAGAGLYLSSEDVGRIAASGFELGNHTYSHVHCRALTTEADLEREIGHNKTALERFSGRPMRAFSFPYGSPLDCTESIRRHLRLTGHEAIFFARGFPNPVGTKDFDRVTLDQTRAGDVRRDIELLPRFRRLAKKLGVFAPAQAAWRHRASRSIRGGHSRQEFP